MLVFLSTEMRAYWVESKESKTQPRGGEGVRVGTRVPGTPGAGSLCVDTRTRRFLFYGKIFLTFFTSSLIHGVASIVSIPSACL